MCLLLTLGNVRVAVYVIGCVMCIRLLIVMNLDPDTFDHSGMFLFYKKTAVEITYFFIKQTINFSIKFFEFYQL